jgi:hypothetical protein
MSLAHVVHRITWDPSSASWFAQDPVSLLSSAKFELTEQELTALQTLMNRPNWQTLFSPTQAEINSFPWLVTDIWAGS